MRPDELVRKELLALLDGGNAHMSFDEVVADFPLEHINSKSPFTPYSIWHIAEHIRITQWDILQFILDPRHVSPHYPEGYRPSPSDIADAMQWQKTIDGFRGDLNMLKAMVEDDGTDLYGPIPHAPRYTIFREIVLAADHNSYHIGEIAIMRQVMKLWPDHRPYLTGRPD